MAGADAAALGLIPIFRIGAETIDGTAVPAPVIVPVRFAVPRGY